MPQFFAEFPEIRSGFKGQDLGFMAEERKEGQKIILNRCITILVRLLFRVQINVAVMIVRGGWEGKVVCVSLCDEGL